MKLFMIKVGKAIKTIQRDGAFNGGKRVMAGFFALWRFVGKGDVLFITGGIGDSARYRCHHTAEELELNGFKCSITVQDNPLLPGYAKKFKVFVFHRVLFTPSVQKMIENIKLQNKEVIFDTDDLVYDPKYLQHMHFFQVMNSLERMLYKNGVGGEILTDPHTKVCSTTTSTLANELEKHDKKVFIVPNKLCKKDVEIAEKILNKNCEPAEEKTEIKIGYFSGTLSHNKDFAVVTEALLDIMEKYSHVKLCLVGPLDVENKLNKFKQRVQQLPFVKRERHFENIAKVDINIIPLESNIFCDAKSELKYFEAGIVKVPTIAIANQTYKQAIEDGVDGFVAYSTEQWVEKLEKLITDAELRKSMREKAREKALTKYTTINAKNEEYYNYLKSKM